MMRTVLVVDDEPIIRMDLRQMLEEMEFQVIGEAGDGFDAVECCRDLNPDIVLLDLEMPVFDGLTAAETIIGEQLAGCVVICTGFADEKFIADASRIGAAGYLIKPIEERTLKPSLEVAWAQSRRFRKLREDADQLEEKLKELKAIDRAKALLAREKGITEAEAYHEMQRSAMEKRIPLSKVADTILRRAARSDTVKLFKAKLMEEKRIGEKEAFRLIRIEAEKKGLSPEAYAAEMLKRGK